MKKLVYYVAASLDYFIAHEDGTTGGFLPEGPHIKDYMDSLQDYDTVLMGRKTYEYGYDFGLKPGAAPYPHMQNYVFSKSIQVDQQAENLHIVSANWIDTVQKLKTKEGSPIYLCGGGQLATTLLEAQLIDEMIIKLNPVIFGKGIPVFHPHKQLISLDLYDQKSYDNGVLFLYYRLKT
ncbi:MAG: dihydrofolate reductase family protein [Bacteroidota bacterium]